MTVHESAARVRALAALDRLTLDGTRWRAPKTAVLRVLRLVTAPQAACNHATADALDDTAAELSALRQELAALRRQLDRAEGDGHRLMRLEHAAGQIHGPLLAELIDRTGGLLDPPASAPAD